jgi:cytidylate kinase
MSASGRCVVAISRQVGAGGAYVGQALARTMGVRYVDREILKEAASMLGRETAEIESLEERVSSVWSRMAGALAWGGPEATYMPPTLPALYEEDLFAIQARIISQIAAQEEAVFVGRAATWVLRERADLLSVFLYAPEMVRAERVKREYDMPDLEEARKMVAQSDQQRSRFLQSVTGGSWLDVTHYHLCVDTGVVGLDETANIVAELAAARRR